MTLLICKLSKVLVWELLHTNVTNIGKSFQSELFMSVHPHLLLHLELIDLRLPTSLLLIPWDSL